MAEWSKRVDSELGEEIKIAAYLSGILDPTGRKIKEGDVKVRMEGPRGERTSVTLADDVADPRNLFALSSALANLMETTLEFKGTPDLLGLKFTIDYPTEDLAARVPKGRQR